MSKLTPIEEAIVRSDLDRLCTEFSKPNPDLARVAVVMRDATRVLRRAAGLTDVEIDAEFAAMDAQIEDDVEAFVRDGTLPS